MPERFELDSTVTFGLPEVSLTEAATYICLKLNQGDNGKGIKLFFSEEDLLEFQRRINTAIDNR